MRTTLNMATLKCIAKELLKSPCYAIKFFDFDFDHVGTYSMRSLISHVELFLWVGGDFSAIALGVFLTKG